MSLPGAKRPAYNDRLEGGEDVTGEGLPAKVEVDQVDTRSGLRQEIDAYLYEDGRPRISDAAWQRALEHAYRVAAGTAGAGILFRAAVHMQTIEQEAEASVARAAELRKAVARPPSAEPVAAPSAAPVVACPECGGHPVRVDNADRLYCEDDHAWVMIGGRAVRAVAAPAAVASATPGATPEPIQDRQEAPGRPPARRPGKRPRAAVRA